MLRATPDLGFIRTDTFFGPVAFLAQIMQLPLEVLGLSFHSALTKMTPGIYQFEMLLNAIIPLYDVTQMSIVVDKNLIAARHRRRNLLYAVDAIDVIFYSDC